MNSSQKVCPQTNCPQTVCFTGHRVIPDAHALLLPRLLDTEILKLTTARPTDFRCGGAIGFDTIAALKVIEIRRRVSGIRLLLFLPCRDQAAKWSDYDRDIYKFILENADSITYTSESYYNGCMLERDRRLVSGSDFCLAYCSKSSGGTAYTLSRAIMANIPVIRYCQ